MNYAEQLKEKETKLINLRATVIAKKQSIKEMLEKRSLAEKQVNEEFNISLSEVQSTLENLETQIDKLCNDLNTEVEEIELEFSKIKC
jgi:hypothetical protein